MNASNPLLLFALGFVVLVVISMLVVKVILRQRSTANERLIQFTGGTPVVESQDIKTRINEAVSKTSRGSNIARDLARADLKLTAGEFVSLKVIAAVGIGVICAWLAVQMAGSGSFLIPVGGGILGAVLGSFLPNVYVGFPLEAARACLQQPACRYGHDAGEFATFRLFAVAIDGPGIA